jgi:ABC-type Fe3+ transport system permease subunit
MRASFVRLVVILLPLASVPLLAHLIAAGRIDLGGGEKDLVISSCVLWRRGWPALRSTVWSAVVGLLGVLVAATILAVFGQLGVAGRF